MLQLILATLQLIAFLGFAAYIAERYEVLKSVSSSTYALEGQQRWQFLAVLWFMGLSNLFMGLEVFGFLASAGIIFAGITIDHRESFSRPLHNIGTVGAIILSFAGLIILEGIVIPAVLFAISIAYIYFGNVNNKTWWIEVSAMVFYFCGLMIMHS